MNNAPAILRTLIIYVVCVPLAVFIGYLLTNPLDTATFTYVGFLLAILLFPILLRWHHPLLIFSWNSGIFVFFLPGQPHLWLVMTAASLGISMLQRALGGVKRFIGVPQVTWALIIMMGVVVLTARLTGMGLHAFGDEVSGGRRYIYLLGAIMGYFAISSRRIPREHASLYIGLFFLPGLLACVGDLWKFMPGSLHFVYLFLPAYESTMMESQVMETMRFVGGMMAAIALFSYMQARYGVRGILLSGKPWRWMVLVVVFAYGMLGGFRSNILLIAAVFFVQFVIEGLYRTKLTLIFAVLGLLGAVALVPLTPHLPHSAQRALAFLPLKIDPGVRHAAEETSDWRFEMWKALLPQIPEHLLLGKGYAISRKDIDSLTGLNASIRSFSGFEGNQYMALAGSFHNGPLSVILIFGLWGCIAAIWFWGVGVWVLYSNYRYGDPALKSANTFLLVAFVIRILFFLFIFGDLGTDMLYFSGWLGLSVSLNGGVCHAEPVPALAANRVQRYDRLRPQLQPAFRRPDVRG